METRKKRKNPVKIAVIAILGLFLLLNVAWVIQVSYVASFEKKLFAYESGMIEHLYKDGEYRISVYAPPSYLDFSGNLSINQNDENGNTDSDAPDLLIWPSFFGETRYGITVPEQLPESEWFTQNGVVVKTVGYNMYVDRDGNPNGFHDADPSKTKKVYNENKPAIDEIFAEMHKVWPNL